MAQGRKVATLTAFLTFVHRPETFDCHPALFGTATAWSIRAPRWHTGLYPHPHLGGTARRR